MVARIKPGTSLRQSFYYNENKVKEGVAKCLHAENYPHDHTGLTIRSKLKMFEKTAALRPKVQVNSVHISLNFDPSESISEQKMISIAKAYMEGIGFGNQPFLVYGHYDAAHPHLHILTTNIEGDGGYISLNLLGKKKSEPTRKLLEEQFNLVKAEAKQSSSYKLEPANAQRIIYGKKESKKALATVLEAITKGYKFTSLHELNAVLGLYNVLADRGNEGSNVYEKGGLLYRILDDNGTPVGVPIKASAFHFSPTLKNFGPQFKLNEKARQPHGQRIRNQVDLYFIKRKSPTLPTLLTALEKAGIHVVLRKNAEGIVYGLTYIDHWTKCVFNGSDLGKSYSAKAIIERCGQKKTIPSQQIVMEERRHSLHPVDHRPSTAMNVDPASANLLETLLQYEYTEGYLPPELSGKKKKRKKKQRK